jgi:hypothetical protein
MTPSASRPPGDDPEAGSRNPHHEDDGQHDTGPVPDFPLIDGQGHVQLECVLRNGELHLRLGRADEPGVAEFIVAITKLADASNAFDAPPLFRKRAWEVLYGAVEAVYLAGRAA